MELFESNIIRSNLFRQNKSSVMKENASSACDYEPLGWWRYFAAGMNSIVITDFYLSSSLFSSSLPSTPSHDVTPSPKGRELQTDEIGADL